MISVICYNCLTMKFEITKPKNQKVSSNELINDLIRVSQQLGKSPTMSEYNQYGNYENSVFCRRFGSWNSALNKANLSPNNKEWTDLELFSNLERVWTCLGKQPTRRDMDKEYSSISSGAYLRRFNAWINALQSFVSYINADDTETVEYKVKPAEYSHKTSRDINLRLRFKVLQRDNYKCCACGRSPATTQGLELQVDHIIPYSKGGETTMDNLQTLCRDCNLGKSNIE